MKRMFQCADNNNTSYLNGALQITTSTANSKSSSPFWLLFYTVQGIGAVFLIIVINVIALGSLSSIVYYCTVFIILNAVAALLVPNFDTFMGSNVYTEENNGRVQSSRSF